MAREARSKYAVLGALSIEPMSGYQIKEVLERTVGHFWTEGYGRIYPTLKQLAAAGLVISRTEPGRGKPDRYVYTLTAAGWEELRHWLDQPVDSMQPGRNELLLKLFFGRHATAGTNLAHLLRCRGQLAGLVSLYEAIEAELSAETSPDQPYWLITLSHGLHVSRAALAWCDETITQLEEQDGSPP